VACVTGRPALKHGAVSDRLKPVKNLTYELIDPLLGGQNRPDAFSVQRRADSRRPALKQGGLADRLQPVKNLTYELVGPLQGARISRML
jgi:hypothetical protein